MKTQLCELRPWVYADAVIVKTRIGMIDRSTMQQTLAALYWLLHERLFFLHGSIALIDLNNDIAKSGKATCDCTDSLQFQQKKKLESCFQ